MRRNSFSLLLYAIGILLGLTLAVLATWADYESAFYGFTRFASTPFRGLSCPVLMTRDETQTVKIKLTNTTAKPLSPSIRTEISTPLTADSKLEFFQLAPGETLLVERTINSDNIDLDQFIFVKAGMFSAYPLPDQESTCGVLILPMHGNGTVILILGTMASLLLTAGGLFLFSQHDPQKNKVRPLLFIAIATVLAMIFGFLGSWILATLMIVLIVLTGFITLNIILG
jgi:hypothetical protein